MCVCVCVCVCVLVCWCVVCVFEVGVQFASKQGTYLLSL